MTRSPQRSPHRPRRIQALIATLSAVVLSAAALVVAAAPAHAASVLLSQGQPTTASSEESASFPPSAATDGNTGTRWSSAFSDPQWLEVDLGSTAQISSVTLDWEAAYATAFQIQVSTDNSTWTSIYSTTAGTGGNQSLTVSGTGRYVRMYGTARATQYGYSLWEFQVYGTASAGTTCSSTDAALNQPTTASSLENSSFPASAATDGNTGTRWSSAWSDPQWLEVDLGSSQTVCGVALDWEAAYATAFQIQVSSDGSTWTSIYSTTTGTGGNQSLTVSGTGRYVRMYGTARATQYGYSLWEFDVYTTGGGSSTGGSGTGSGAPPASFWGNTSAIPAASNVLEVAVTNQTNGQYPDSEVYWSFNGQEESIAQQPYIDMPANSAGRMYFYLGSPNSQYYDFIEFTVGSASINVDTTRVDRFGLKLALLVHSHDGTEQEVGENYATFQESRAATFQRFENSVPTAFKELATDDAPYGIPSPGNDAAFQSGGAYANYFNSALTAAGDTSDTSLDVFGCAGTLSGNPTLCAALNRGVAQLPTSEQSTPSLFYQTAPANYYAQFWHQNAINGVQYGFPYDDVDGQSSDLSVANPQYMVVAVGW
ncbi:discoidin domain-containing protein [Actinospica sp. MGRD01-02]|uniref:Discoidin domain-containing protein n=1 Tax=Actinospica acidithermotolerans TaxID=2828514 RepID=A0A941IIK2_9ACTN|nr:discoidin domain-containing protein [Actinospica acidithermotolerans]MBR7826228.1 discoidin domain-containing protein [Actinospica acidithermotolerans]